MPAALTLDNQQVVEFYSHLYYANAHAHADCVISGNSTNIHAHALKAMAGLAIRQSIHEIQRQEQHFELFNFISAMNRIYS